MIPKKLPKLPRAMFNTMCLIRLGNGEITEDGEQIIHTTISDKVNVNLKPYQVMTADKQLVRISGKIIYQCDVAPGLEIVTGTATIADVVYKVYACQKVLNPDGTVHHTVLEVV